MRIIPKIITNIYLRSDSVPTHKAIITELPHRRCILITVCVVIIIRFKQYARELKTNGLIIIIIKKKGLTRTFGNIGTGVRL